MFNKKPRRNFRQRKASSSDEEGEQKRSEDGEKNEEAQSVINKPSKVAHCRGISCTSKRESTPPKPVRGDAGAAEERTELSAHVADSRTDTEGEKQKSNAVLSFTDDKEAEGPEFKLKKTADKDVLFQARRKAPSAAKTTQSSVVGGVAPRSLSPKQCSDNESSPSSHHQHDIHDNDDDDDENSNDSGGGSDGDGHYHDDDDDDAAAAADDHDDDDNDASSLSSFSSSEHFNPRQGNVCIPKAKEISAARRQRRAARARRDFISLRVDGGSSAGSTPDHRSREVEESPIDYGDDDEHLRRIEFAPRPKSLRERIAENMGSDGSVSDSEREEQELWEETQIGKGVKRRPGEQSPSGSECSVRSSSSSSNNRRGRQTQKKKSTGARLPKNLPAITVSMVKRRITGKLDSLREVHRARQATLRRMEHDVDSARTTLENLEGSLAQDKLKFYRAMTLYIHNLVDCLQEKVVHINALELELHDLLSDQMEALSARRRQAVREQTTCLQQLSYGTDEQTGGAANGTQAQSQQSHGQDTGDIPEDTPPSAEEEELLQTKRADVLSKSEAVFSDVQEDFCDVKKILSRFEEWRGSYSDSYHNAYISLCLPKLLNPIIRLQLLTWNPLKDSCEDFENLPWFKALETFCHGHGFEELEHTDRQTLSNVVERTVVPKLTVFVELVWDPMSLQQSVCLSDVCHRLREDHSIFEGEQSKPVKSFLQAVVSRLRSCVDEDVFIPIYPKNLLEDSSSPQCRFRDQQFWTAVKLLGNMGKWDLLLPESTLKELMLDKLLNRYLMITLLNLTLSDSSVHTCKKVADCLPSSWFKGQNACLPQLQSLSKHLVQMVHSICKQQPPEDPNTRSTVVSILQILSRIRCFDAIMALADKYKYQDAIYSHQLLHQEVE